MHQGCGIPSLADPEDQEEVTERMIRKMPRNNDGRKICAWCGGATKRGRCIRGYDWCPACGR